jgi:Response regulator containing CheY-like receiver and SARP domains
VIKAIIVEDEWYTLEDIKNMVEASGFIEVCGVYQNPLIALKESESLPFQAAFIDIEMPEMDGLTMAEKLLEKNPAIQIVFITAYNQYAVNAFDINALDYIMKPINIQRFNKMLEKLKKSVSAFKYSENDLGIKCFGDFEVKIGDNPVKWERAKAEELFAYLLLNHKRKIHKDKIIEELWNGYEPEKALAILQTSVCKIRSILSPLRGNVTLEYSNSRYMLTIKSCRCDLFKVEYELDNLVMEALDTYQYMEKICGEVSKGIMTGGGYLWAITREAELNNRVCSVLNRIVKYQLKNGEKELATRYGKLKEKIEACED